MGTLAKGQVRMIYLRLDMKASCENLRAWKMKVNAQLKKDRPQDHKSVSLKPAHLLTAEKILEIYAAHCFRNYNQKLPHDRIMWITCGLIRKKTTASEATVYRHLERLALHGFIKQKTFRGTNSAPHYVLNPDLLVAMNDPAFLELLPDRRPGEMPSFSAGSTAYFSFCEDTASSSIPTRSMKDKNARADVDSGRTAIASSIGAIAGTHDLMTTSKQNHEKQGKQAQGTEGAQKQPTTYSGMLSRERQKAGGGARPAETKYYIALCLSFLLNMLYKGRKVTESQLDETSTYIEKFFENAPYPGKRYEAFIERVMIKKKHLARYPEFYLPQPHIWMNPLHSWGFAWTKKPFDEIECKRRSNPDHYSNLRLLGSLLRNYVKNPCLDTFRYAEFKLGNLKDHGRLLKAFHEAALDPEDLQNILYQLHNYETTEPQAGAQRPRP